MKLVTQRSGAKFCVLQVFVTETYHFDQFSERFRSGDLQLRWIVDAKKRLEICCLDYFDIVVGVAIRHNVEKLKSGTCWMLVIKIQISTIFWSVFLASIRPCVEYVGTWSREGVQNLVLPCCICITKMYIFEKFSKHFPSSNALLLSRWCREAPRKNNYFFCVVTCGMWMYFTVSWDLFASR